MNTSVVYPPKAAPAIGYLKSSSNDIEIFVEDSSLPNLWVKLLKKYLPNNIRLESVTPLGGRKNVLDACKADQAIDGRKKLYIIDGDLDFLLGTTKPKLKHLYKLRAYCVENYLLNEDSIVELATLFDAKIDKQLARQKLDYKSWLDDNDKLMGPLYVSYATSISLLDEKIETVGYNITRLAKDRPDKEYLCPDKVRKRITCILLKTRRKVDRNKMRSRFDYLVKNMSSKKAINAASGKDCIIPLLYARMKKNFGMNVKMEIFLMMLADKAEANFDPYLSRRLNKLCL